LRRSPPWIRLPRGRLPVGLRSRPARALRRAPARARGRARKCRAGGGGMRSHLVEGTVRHRRARPFVYSLEHDVSYLAIDLDELDGVTSWSRLLGRNRRAVLELRDSDHLVPPSPDMRTAFLDHLRASGEDPTG